MKKSIKYVSLAALLLLGTALFNNLQADPPPPPPGGGHGQAGNQTGGGAAPLRGGIALLVGLAAGYAGRKLWSEWPARKAKA
jgi:hypothetical protein